MKQVLCSNCGKLKWITYQQYLDNLSFHKISTKEELNKFYLCRICRKLLKPNGLHDTPEYKEIRQSLQSEVNEAVRRGINDPLVRQNFLNNVKAILDKRLIKQYSFQVMNAELMGIVLYQLPFFGNVLIPLKNRGKYGNR